MEKELDVTVSNAYCIQIVAGEFLYIFPNSNKFKVKGSQNAIESCCLLLTMRLR